MASSNTSESTATHAAPPEGAPGARANTPAAGGDQGAGGNELTTTEKTELVENFEPSESVTTTTSSPGGVQRFRVSAFIQGSYKDELDANNQQTGKKTYVPLTDEQKTKLDKTLEDIAVIFNKPSQFVPYDSSYFLFVHKYSF